MLISPFSAISSWEGYEYQGHIAVFVVLQKIRELIVINNNAIKLNFKMAHHVSVMIHIVAHCIGAEWVKMGPFDPWLLL